MPLVTRADYNNYEQYLATDSEAAKSLKTALEARCPGLDFGNQCTDAGSLLSPSLWSAFLALIWTFMLLK